MTEQKKMYGEELAAKILEEFGRVNEEYEIEIPFMVTVHTEETEFGLADVPGVEIHNEWDDPIFIPDIDGMTEEEAKNFVEDLAENFRD